MIRTGDEKMGFGERLRSLREEKKITQKELAKLFKIAESTVSMYERGEREPNFEIVNKIANFFNVSADYLLGRTDDPTPPGGSDQGQLSEREQLLKELEQYGNLFFQGGGEDLTDEELREIVRAMREAAQTAAKNTYNVINKYRK